MNILFFLTPKEDVAHVDEDDTMRQVLEKMEHHGYTAIPLLSREGKYIGTITEGDLLWFLKDRNFPDLKLLEDMPITSIDGNEVLVHHLVDGRPLRQGDEPELRSRRGRQACVYWYCDEKRYSGIPWEEGRCAGEWRAGHGSGIVMVSHTDYVTELSVRIISK